MTVSPAAGVAPLNVGVAQPQPSASLHAVLAGGANLGGSTVTADQYGLPAMPDVGSAVAGSSGTPLATGGGGAQAVQGAAQLDPAQLVPVLQQVVATVNQLVAVLQAQGGVSGGGAPGGSVGQCGMPGCTMDHSIPQAARGASGAPDAAAAPRDAREGARRHAGHVPQASPPLAVSAPGAGGVDPSTVKDKTSLAGLSAASKRGLEEAHRFGLPLVSGKRGGDTKSDHFHGNAIDVGTLPIGAPSSKEGTPQMKAFAEHMRLEGKAGRLGVKYVILDGKIASGVNDWAWRPYTAPGYTPASLRKLSPGEFNRLQHNDHVHVSFR